MSAYANTAAEAGGTATAMTGQETADNDTANSGNLGVVLVQLPSLLFSEGGIPND